MVQRQSASTLPFQGLQGFSVDMMEYFLKKCPLNVEPHLISLDSPEGYQDNLDRIAERKYSLMIGPGKFHDQGDNVKN